MTPALLRRGDLRLVAPPEHETAAPRLDLGLGLGLALAVDRTEGRAGSFFEFALVHPCTQLATSADGVVPGGLAGTPFAVVVQTDLRGVAWVHGQALKRVGHLTEQTLATISGLVESGCQGSPEGIRVGVLLAGPCDRRWPFKVDEGTALDRLTSDCTRELLAATPGPR